MFPLKWTPNEVMELVQIFEARHQVPDAGALFVWAAWTAESLQYLNEIDRAHELDPPTGGHHRDIIDVAHARWATTTSITALDLCAAGLGQAFCEHHGRHELKLGNFDPDLRLKRDRREQRAQRRGKLPVAALNWVDEACRDPRYKTLRQARDSLTHSRLRRHLVLQRRLSLELETGTIGVRQLVENARDCARDHVAMFLGLLPLL